jgi:hypothetical protein
MPLLQAELTRRKKMDVAYQRHLTCSVMCESTVFKIVYMATVGNEKKIKLMAVYMTLML